MPIKGNSISTAARRRDFIEKLKTLGPGELCTYWPWSTLRGMYVTVNIKGQRTTVHRWVYEQINGPVPKGLEVCHSCDNPPCVRPSHLWVGTHGENLKDAYRKGRKHNNTGAPAGEAHPMAKLSARDVSLIRALHGEGMSVRAMARVFGVSATAISHIVNGRAWRE